MSERDGMDMDGLDMDGFDPAAAGWRELPDVGFTALVGPIWEREDGTAVRYGMLTRACHVNANGVVHGGVIATFADCSLAFANRLASGGRKQATIQLDIHYVESAQVGDFLEADVVVSRSGRSVAFMTGQITAGGRLIATAQGVWKLLGPA